VFLELNNSAANVYAHTFTPNDSASFLSLIYRIKNEAQLVQSNLLSNAFNSTGLAQQHAQNAITILNQTLTKEIAERNHRIASAYWPKGCNNGNSSNKTSS
jgi:hypothetical protein